MKKACWQYVMSGLAVLVVLGMLTWLVHALSQADPNVQSGVLALIGIVAAAIIAHGSAKKREIAARHFESKRKAYTDFVDTMWEMLAEHRQGMDPKMSEHEKNLLTSADANVIKTWHEIQKTIREIRSSGKRDPQALLLIFDDLFRAIRKDLGNDDERLERGDLMSLLLHKKARAELKE